PFIDHNVRRNLAIARYEFSNELYRGII
ncbi:hypothetical protein, partial [Listeria monocytogenes]